MKKLGESCREAWGKLPGSLKKIKAELEKTWRKLEKPLRKITGSFGKLENGQRENCGKGKRMANQLETVLKKTQAVYKQAAEELAKKLADFQSKFAAKDKEKRALLAAGEITKQDYQNWLAGQVFQGKQWEAKAKEAAETMVHADTEAAAIVNDGCMTAYAAAMNYGTYELEKTTGLSTGFTLYNRETVSRLLAKDPQLLPYWKLDQPKDYVWNYEKVKSTILQGIIQGKPIPEITKDLASKLQTNNTNRMRLFARTEMTGAHNAGRIDALHRAADLGIKVQKKWIATNDNRTRDAHADLDGQIREVDEPFDSELGPIDYPGDPSADPANVYNCRCAMVYIYPELEDAPEGTEEEPEYEQMTFDQWMEAQENQEAVQGETDPETVTAEDAREPEPEIMETAEELEETEPEPILEEEQQPEEPEHEVVQGTDISDTWERRPEEFATEIEDVINAQGFDGNPMVVGKEEFDQAVKESNFVAQRSYSAPDQETLDAYREQLYNGGQGNWYVDCGTGGAQYGQGMYCAADYTGTVTDGMKEEMQHYTELGQDRAKEEAWKTVKAETDWKQEWIDRDKEHERKYGEPTYYTRKYGIPTEEEFDIYKKFASGEVGRVYDLPPEERQIWQEAADKKLTWEFKEINGIRRERFDEEYTGYSRTETMTLTPDAKIITYDDAARGMMAEAFGKEAAAEAGIPDRYQIKDMMDSGLPVQDVGVWAAKHGYDAINATGHGESGSYTVILNRTKTIILKGD